LAINVGELNIYRNAYGVADTRPGLSYLLITPGLLDAARAELAGGLRHSRSGARWMVPATLMY
jgi:hypothetical protein